MIFRNRRRQGNFTQLDNELIRDKQLSYKAKGILAYLMSRPPDWQVYETEIANHSRDGIKSVRSGVKELLAHGYLARQVIRDEKGRFQGYLYDASDDPSDLVNPHGSTIPPEVPKPENRKRHTTNKDRTNSGTKRRKAEVIVLPVGPHMADEMNKQRAYGEPRVVSWMDGE
jgi:hypothetical protein